MKASELIKKYSILQIAQRLTLAKKYPDTARPADFYIQPKLDGVRAFYIPNVGFVSRDGVKLPLGRLKHIQLPDMYDMIVDGELYCHGKVLGDINSRVAFTSRIPHEDEECIKFHAFDVMHETADLVHRLEIVNQIMLDSVNVMPVITYHGSTLEDLHAHHNRNLNDGFEGSMIKAKTRGYITGRSKDVLKWKHWFYVNAVCIGWNAGTAGKKYEGSTGSLRFRNTFIPELCWDITGMTDAARTADPETFIGKTALIRYSRRTETGQIMHATIREWVK